MPCCCYILPYVINVHVLLFGYCQLMVTAHQRFKRQSLPTDHIMVHSFNSNVSIADWVVVISDESKIEFQEKFLHGEVWSGSSRLDFQPHGQAENFSALNNVLSIFELSQAMLQTKCEQIQMFLRTNRSTDGHSYVQYKADHNVTLILSNGITQVNVIGGRWAHVVAVTWQLPVAKRIIIGSNIASGLNRQLHIVSVNNNYNIDITLFDAQMQMRYGNITVQMSSDYRFLRLSSGLYTVDLQTVLSPFEMLISDQEMLVRCINERAVVRMLPSSSNIIINTDQFSRVIIDRGSGSIILGGQEVSPAGDINLLSMQLNILLKSGDISSIHATANRSQITMQTNSTNMVSTASHHTVDIIGGQTSLHAYTGNVSMDIIANAHLEPLPTMLAPFAKPQDNFQDIGPILDSISSNFSLIQRNFSIDNAIPPIQIPQTTTSHSISAGASNIQTEMPPTAITASRPVYESSWEPVFTIATFPWITVINPTTTTELINSERLPATVSTNITTSGTQVRNASSTGSTASPLSTSTSQIGSVVSATASATTSTPRSTGTTTGTSTSPTVFGTTARSTASAAVSTLTSATTSTVVSTTTSVTLPPPTVSPSSRLSPSMTVHSSASVAGTSPTSTIVLSSISVVPITESTSKLESEAMITGAPVTSRTQQRTPSSSTSTTSSPSAAPGIVITGEVDSDGGTWEIDENRDSEQTELIEFSWETEGISPTSTTITTARPGQSPTTQKARSTTCIEITPPETQNTPMFTKEPTIIVISEATMEPIVVKTDRSIGSVWTPFPAPPFEFPPTDPSLPTTPPRNGNLALQKDVAGNEKISGSGEASQDDEEWSKTGASNVPSVSMVDALKDIFGKIVQQSSSRTKNLANDENSVLEFGEQQNLSSSKSKRALPGFEDEEIYEVQLKIPPDVNLTAPDFRRELLLALKKFALFANLHERRPAVHEDSMRIKVAHMERNGEYLKVLYTIVSGAKGTQYTSDCDPDEVNDGYVCVRNRRFSGIDLMFIVIGIMVAVLLSVGAFLVRYKKYSKSGQVSPYLDSCYSIRN